MSAPNYLDIEKRIRQARKLARKYGLRLSLRYDTSGGDDFWLLGPPRSFEDIEFELLTRERIEREQQANAEARKQRSGSAKQLREKLREFEPPARRRPSEPVTDVPSLIQRIDKHASEEMARRAIVLEALTEMGQDTPDFELAQLLHMDVWEVREHLRILNRNLKDDS